MINLLNTLEKREKYSPPLWATKKLNIWPQSSDQAIASNAAVVLSADWRALVVPNGVRYSVVQHAEVTSGCTFD